MIDYFVYTSLHREDPGLEWLLATIKFGVYVGGLYHYYEVSHLEYHLDRAMEAWMEHYYIYAPLIQDSVSIGPAMVTMMIYERIVGFFQRVAKRWNQRKSGTA